MKHDPENMAQTKGKGKESPPSSSPQRNYLERSTLTGKRLPGKGNPGNMLCLSERVIVHKLMLVITGIHLDVPFTQEGNCRLGSKCAFKQTEKAGSEPKKRHNSVVLAKTLDHTPNQRSKSLKSRAKVPFCTGCQLFQ